MAAAATGGATPSREVPSAFQIALYSGAEVGDAAALRRLTGLPVATTTRELLALAEQDGSPTLVVPVTTGRDLNSVTAAAQALQWAHREGAQLCLAPAIATGTYAIARLRTVLRKVAQGAVPEGTEPVDGTAETTRPGQPRRAVLIAATSVNPFADAELIRRVRLGQQHSDDVLVATAFLGAGGWPDPPRAIRDLRLLGATEIHVASADVVPDAVAREMEGVRSALDGAEHIVPGVWPLMTRTALATAVASAVQTGMRAWGRGDDGIATGLLADHDQGFAHSHGEEDGHGHSHGHHHGHGHGHHHGHGHDHNHGHGHHDYDHGHGHGHHHHEHGHDHGPAGAHDPTGSRGASRP